MSREKVFVLAWLRHTAVYHSLYHRRGWTDWLVRCANPLGQ